MKQSEWFTLLIMTRTLNLLQGPPLAHALPRAFQSNCGSLQTLLTLKFEGEELSFSLKAPDRAQAARCPLTALPVGGGPLVRMKSVSRRALMACRAAISVRPNSISCLGLVNHCAGRPGGLNHQLLRVCTVCKETTWPEA